MATIKEYYGDQYVEYVDSVGKYKVGEFYLLAHTSSDHDFNLLVRCNKIAIVKQINSTFSSHRVGQVVCQVTLLSGNYDDYPIGEEFNFWQGSLFDLYSTLIKTE